MGQHGGLLTVSDVYDKVHTLTRKIHALGEDIASLEEDSVGNEILTFSREKFQEELDELLQKKVYFEDPVKQEKPAPVKPKGIKAAPFDVFKPRTEGEPQKSEGFEPRTEE